MLQKILSILTTILALTFLVRPGLAADNLWTHSVYFENDLFAGTDQAYTNGVKYSLISPDLSPHAAEGQVPRRILEYIHRIPFIKESSPNYSHKAEFSFGQNMYTPENIGERNLVVSDRPYAGWSYFGMAYHRKFFETGKPSFMDSVEVQIGLIGPESFAEETQKFIHKLRDLQRPEGWDNQLHNEPGLVIAYERKWLFFSPDKHGLDYDAILHAGASVGNVSTYANAGMELRFGWNLPKNFGASIIRPTGSSRLSVDEDLSAYLFAATDGRAVGLDIFLDGNNFTDSHDVDKRPFVADLAVGMGISYRKFMCMVTRIDRTKEFATQPHSHAFGSLVFSFFARF